MPIDSNIALGVKPLQIEGPVDNYAKLLTLKDLMQRSQAGELQMQDAQRARDDEMATRQAYMQSGGDGNKLRALLLGAGNYKAANAYDSQEMARKKAQGEAEKAQLEGVMQKLSVGAQLLGGVRDQASYDSARATAQANGLDVSRMPAQYDPAFIQQKMQEGQTVKEQLEQKWKAMEYTTPNANTRLQSQTSLTTNALTNATSRANNAATVGQAERSSLRTDARTRESTAASMGKPFEVTGPDGTPMLVQQDKQGNISPVEGYGPKVGSVKPLAASVLKQVQEVRDNAVTMDRLNSDFKSNYAGKGILGLGADMQMGASATLGADQGAVAWWKDYKKQAELVERHAMFGASLTPGEQASWRSADIGPGMSANTIKTNLATRAALTKKVLETTRQDMVDAGHSETRVNAVAGRGPKSAPNIDSLLDKYK